MSARLFEYLTQDSRPAPAGANGKRPPRIALYSHDTQGLGHIRRNMLISRALCRGRENPIILLLSGLREATAFAMPQGVDCVTLPSLGKGVDGTYFPRSLDVPMADLIKVRSRTISAVLRTFDPDALIVDKVPRGVFDELLPALGLLRSRGRTRIVLGLREILDEPEAVRREWMRGDYDAAIRAYYDRIWVYGDRRIYDLVDEYELPPDIARLVEFTGYLNPLDAPESGRGQAPAGLEGVGRPMTLCVVGGGRDGLPLADAFLRSTIPGEGVLVTGPLMPDEGRAALRALAAARPNVRLLEFVTDPCPLLERADQVIAMGGYNTICEILAYETPALIVPRTEPRTEQLIRARRFTELGLVDMLHPDDLDPNALSAWMARTNGRPRPRPAEAVRFDGVRRLPELLDDVLVATDPEEEIADVAP